jgi:hypothetical protein
MKSNTKEYYFFAEVVWNNGTFETYRFPLFAKGGSIQWVQEPYQKKER